MKHDDDYLWDPTATAEPEIKALEEQLQGRAWSGTLPELSAPQKSARRWPMILAGVAALALGILSIEDTTDSPSYRVELVAGGVLLDGQPLGKESGLAVGGRLTSDNAGQAVIHIPGLGSVRLNAESSMAMLDPTTDQASRDWSPAQALMSLEQGSFEAVIFAAPGAFQVRTPAGLSVDLGCVYQAEVMADGSTRMQVTAGRVAFEGSGRRVIVPSGAAIVARPGVPPSTPIFINASPVFIDLVKRLDSGHALDEVELGQLLASARPSDAISLAHLVDHPTAGPTVREHLVETYELEIDAPIEAWLDQL